VIGDILQPTHLLFVLVVALLVLGPKRLPEVGRALGNGLRDFKSAINGEETHHEQISDAPGFESYREEALDDAQASEMHEREPAVVASADQSAGVARTTEKPAPPAHPEAATAEQPAESNGAEPESEGPEPAGKNTEQAERLG
jgi:sec-independent protein translocase protein TatA